MSRPQTLSQVQGERVPLPADTTYAAGGKILSCPDAACGGAGFVREISGGLGVWGQCAACDADLVSTRHEGEGFQSIDPTAPSELGSRTRGTRGLKADVAFRHRSGFVAELGTQADNHGQRFRHFKRKPRSHDPQAMASNPLAPTALRGTITRGSRAASVQHERDLEVHAKADHLSITDQHLLLFHPRALDIAHRLAGLTDRLSDGALKTVAARRC